MNRDELLRWAYLNRNSSMNVPILPQPKGLHATILINPDGSRRNPYDEYAPYVSLATDGLGRKARDDAERQRAYDEYMAIQNGGWHTLDLVNPQLSGWLRQSPALALAFTRWVQAAAEREREQFVREATVGSGAYGVKRRGEGQPDAAAMYRAASGVDTADRARRYVDARRMQMLFPDRNGVGGRQTLGIH